jgi:hypothetical protein
MTVTGDWRHFISISEYQPGEPLLHLLLDNYTLSKEVLHAIITEFGLDGRGKNVFGETLLMKLSAWWNESYYQEGSFHTLSRQAMFEGLLHYLIHEVGIDVNDQDNAGGTALMRVAECVPSARMAPQAPSAAMSTANTTAAVAAAMEVGEAEDAVQETDAVFPVTDEPMDGVDEVEGEGFEDIPGNQNINNGADVIEVVEESPTVEIVHEVRYERQATAWQKFFFNKLLDFGADLAIKKHNGQSALEFYPWISSMIETHGDDITPNHRGKKRKSDEYPEK